MEKIRKGDNVIVLTGKDKGKRGVVLARVDVDHVKVEGVNVVKKHQRPNPMLQKEGGVVEKTMAIHISNVALVNKDGKADRVAIKEEEGKKIRVFKTNGAAVA